jgi:hypothetical protein
LKAIDKYAKDISKKLDSMFPNLAPSTTNPSSAIPTNVLDATNYNQFLKNVKDDNYYLERNLEPPRFELYKLARRLMIENYNTKNKKPRPAIVKTEDLDDYMPIYGSTTQDELDYRLKMDLRHTTPEQRYQERRETYYFHKLYRDNGEYGCNPTMRPEICVPECRYYGETGRFEDDELVAEYKEAVALYEKYNAILEIKIQDDNSFYITQTRKYNS